MRAIPVKDGFSESYAAHFQQIAGQLHAYLGDEGEAQDVTQEAFCRALDRHLRVAKRYAERATVACGGSSPGRVVIVNALAALPANHRLAVLLHHMGDLSTSEIAGSAASPRVPCAPGWRAAVPSSPIELANRNCRPG
jgi:DNA-directed RNA polymerase specialized sigma24 family protein